MKKKEMFVFLPIVLLLITGIFFIIPAFSNPLPASENIITSPATVSSFTPFHTVCTSVQRGKGSKYYDSEIGEYENLGCTRNNITLIGLNVTRDFLGAFRATGNAGNFTFIALCNATRSPSGSLCGDHQNVGTGKGFPNESGNIGAGNQEYISNGLTRAAGNWSITNSQPGNWSIAVTYTSSGVAGLEVNGTALFNQSAISSGWNGTMLAVNKFAHTVLDGTSSDTLTVTWIGGIS